jgi:hypothetical protein
MHGLPFDEVDADDLSLDLAAHDDRVIGDDGANTGQIDRHVMLSDRSGDDRHDRRCCSILGSAVQCLRTTIPFCCSSPLIY